MPKDLFSGSADFTVAIFKIPQMSKHFSSMLLGVQFKSKHLREDEKNCHFATIFDLKFLFDELYAQLKLQLTRNFLSASYFYIHPIEKCYQLFLLQENRALPSTK